VVGVLLSLSTANTWRTTLDRNDMTLQLPAGTVVSFLSDRSSLLHHCSTFMMEAIRTAIIGSEDTGRRKISRMLGEDPEVAIVGEFPAEEETISRLPDVTPELLFVDVHASGFTETAFFEELMDSSGPVAVFITSFDQHTIQTFQEYGVDYVLKPCDRGRFQDAVRHAKDRVLQRRNEPVEPKQQELSTDSSQTPRPQVRRRIMVKSAGRISFLKAEEIDWMQAQGDYVRLYAQGKKFLVREKIGEMEQQFSSDHFIRIHRSTIVNVERIKEMQPLIYGEYAVILNDGTRLTLSRSFRGKVFSRLTRA
jgi:two-component system LytT family response regulator